MTNTDHNTVDHEPAVADYLKAAEDVVCLLVNQLSPKKERAVRKTLKLALQHLEAGMLPANVVRIRERRYDVGAPERQRLATAIRQIAAPVLS